jgi:RNA polymerase sigma-70 factor (ECF subfamily)
MMFRNNTVGIGNIDGLYSYALTLTRNRTEAEDLVRQTYARANGGSARHHPDGDVKSWMFAILRNIWLNQMQQCGSASDVAEIDRERPANHAEMHPSQDRTNASSGPETVRDALIQLPLELCEIILLRECEDMSYREIAAVLDCQPGTVMSRLAQARSELRLLLSATLKANQTEKKEACYASK